LPNKVNITAWDEMNTKKWLKRGDPFHYFFDLVIKAILVVKNANWS